MNVELRNELNILLEKYNSPEELVQISDFLFEKGLFRYVITPDIFDSLMYNMYRKSLEERNKYLEILEDYINVKIESSYSLQWD